MDGCCRDDGYKKKEEKEKEKLKEKKTLSRIAKLYVIPWTNCNYFDDGLDNVYIIWIG